MASGAPNPPRNHHYIPEFYQRQWAGPDGQVERFVPVADDRLVVRRVFPSQAGFERDLYRAPGEHDDEWAAQKLEVELFADIDDRAAKALNAILESKSPPRDPAVRSDWTRFMRSMLHRTPQHMAATLAKYEEIWRTPSPSTQASYETMRRLGYPPTAEQFLEMLDPNVARDTAFRLFFDAVDSDRLTNYVVSLQWSVIDCEGAGFSLLLSDNPVVLVPLETEAGHLAMPLTPTKLLVATGKPSVLGGIQRMTPRAIARIANNLAVERAYHCVISVDRAQEPFIRRNFGRRRIGSLATGFRQP